MSAPHAVPASFSFTNLFEIKEKKLKEAYLQNRGNVVLYLEWVNLLVSACHWKKVSEIVDTYRADSEDIRIENLLILAKRDLSLENQDKDIISDLLFLYYSHRPHSIEVQYLIAGFVPHKNLVSSKYCNSICTRTLYRSLRAVFNGDIADLNNIIASDNEDRIDWLQSFFYLHNRRGSIPLNVRIPCYAFTPFLTNRYANRITDSCPHLENIIQVLVKENPFDLRLICELILYYLLMRDNEKATKYYKLAIQIASDPPAQALFAFASYNIYFGDLGQAGVWLERPEAKSADCASARIKLAMQGGISSEGAIRAIDEGLRLFPNVKLMIQYKCEYLEHKLNGLIAAHEINGTFVCAEELLKLKPDSILALRSYAIFSKDFKKAWAEIDKYIKLTSTTPTELIIRLSILSSMRLEEGRKHAEDFLKENPDSLECNECYVQIIIKLRKFELALEHLNNLKIVLNSNLLTLKANALFRLERDDEAISHLSRSKESYDGLMLSGEIFMKRGEYDIAYKYFRNICATHDVPGLIAYLTCLMNLNRIEEAKAFYSKIDESRRILLGSIGADVERAELPKTILRRTSPKSSPTHDGFIQTSAADVPEIKIKEDLVKDIRKFSSRSCVGSDGINPLREHPSVLANRLMTMPAPKISWAYYPNNYAERLHRAMSHIQQLSMLLNQSCNTTITHSMIYHLSSMIEEFCPLKPSSSDIEGMNIFNVRVLPLEELRALRFMILNIPAIITPKTIHLFVKELISLNLPHSIKMSYTDSEPLDVSFNVIAPNVAEWWKGLDEAEKIEAHYTVIRDELEYFANSLNYFEDLSEAQPFLVAAHRIRTSIHFIMHLLPERGQRLLNGFSELDPDGEGLFDFSVDNVNYLLQTARAKLELLERF